MSKIIKKELEDLRRFALEDDREISGFYTKIDRFYSELELEYLKKAIRDELNKRSKRNYTL